MDDKNFELLTKMYSEFTKRFDGIDKRFDGIDSEIGSLKVDVRNLKNDVIRLENTTDANFKALFDGYHQTYEKLTVVEQDVKKLSAKVEKQDLEITVIKGGKARKVN